jgi:hypothetical protein
MFCMSGSPRSSDVRAIGTPAARAIISDSRGKTIARRAAAPVADEPADGCAPSSCRRLCRFCGVFRPRNATLRRRVVPFGKATRARRRRAKNLYITRFVDFR